MPRIDRTPIPDHVLRAEAQRIVAGERDAESRIIGRTEREIASAIEALTEKYPASAHPGILHAARVALGNAPERWHH